MRGEAGFRFRLEGRSGGDTGASLVVNVLGDGIQRPPCRALGGVQLRPQPFAQIERREGIHSALALALGGVRVEAQRTDIAREGLLTHRDGGEGLHLGFQLRVGLVDDAQGQPCVRHLVTDALGMAHLEHGGSVLEGGGQGVLADHPNHGSAQEQGAGPVMAVRQQDVTLDGIAGLLATDGDIAFHRHLEPDPFAVAQGPRRLILGAAVVLADGVHVAEGVLVLERRIDVAHHAQDAVVVATPNGESVGDHDAARAGLELVLAHRPVQARPLEAVSRRHEPFHDDAQPVPGLDAFAAYHAVDVRCHDVTPVLMGWVKSLPDEVILHDWLVLVQKNLRNRLVYFATLLLSDRKRGWG